MDGYDAFSAGVEPGGLRNRNEIKVLIAFLLKNTERGLLRRQLMEAQAQSQAQITDHRARAEDLHRQAEELRTRLQKLP